MRLPKYLEYPFWAAGILAAVFALIALIWNAVGVAEPPVITAYRNVDGFAERAYKTFPDCQIAQWLL